MAPIATVLDEERDRPDGAPATLSRVPPLMVMFGDALNAPKLASALIANMPLVMVVPPE